MGAKQNEKNHNCVAHTYEGEPTLMWHLKCVKNLISSKCVFHSLSPLSLSISLSPFALSLWLKRHCILYNALLPFALYTSSFATTWSVPCLHGCSSKLVVNSDDTTPDRNHKEHGERKWSYSGSITERNHTLHNTPNTATIYIRDLRCADVLSEWCCSARFWTVRRWLQKTKNKTKTQKIGQTYTHSYV